MRDTSSAAWHQMRATLERGEMFEYRGSNRSQRQLIHQIEASGLGARWRQRVLDEHDSQPYDGAGARDAATILEVWPKSANPNVGGAITPSM